MIRTFATATSALTQPDSAGEKVIIRSSSASDTSQTVTASGTVGSSADSEAISLVGKKEVESTKSFKSLVGCVLSAACAGIVKVLGQGTAGEGRIIVSTQPADGDNLLVGLTGLTQTYVFRQKAQSTLVCQAGSALISGDYFDASLSGTTKRFWYDVESGGGAPADPGGGLIEIDVTSTNTDAEVATATEAAIEAITNLASSVDSATITVDYGILGVLAFTDGPGDALGTITQVRAGTADAANQIAIGATASDTAENIKLAINDEGTEGDNYGTGTAANAYVSATQSGTIVTITDRIACNRELAWAISQTTGETLSVGVPIGGVDGTVLAQFAVGDLVKNGAITMDDEALSLDLLPALSTWTSDWITVRGGACTLYLKAENLSSAITASYEVATDTNYPLAGATSLTNLDNNSYAATVAERNIHYIRLTLVNPNSSSASVNAKLVTA